MNSQIEFVEMARSNTIEARLNEELAKLKTRYPWITHAVAYVKSGVRANRTCIVELEVRMPGNPLFIREENEKFSITISRVFEAMRRLLEKRKAKMYSHGK